VTGSLPRRLPVSSISTSMPGCARR